MENRSRFLFTLTLGAVFLAVLPLRPTFSLPPVSQAATPAALSPISAIQVTIDYVMTPADGFAKESHHIAVGKEHDSLLLAALLKDGAREMKVHPVTVRDGNLLRFPFWQGTPPLYTYLRLRPSIKTDGLILVTTLAQHGTLPAIREARIKTVSQGAVNGFSFHAPSAPPPLDKRHLRIGKTTFQNGQTLILDCRHLADRKIDIPSVSVIFVKVQSVTGVTRAR